MLSRILFAALAAVQLAVAAVHLLWLGELEAGVAAAGVAAAYRELLLLAVAAVAVLLAGLAALAAWFATGSHWREPAAPAFALVGALIWAGRTVLEVRHPLQVPLLGATGLSPAVLVGSAFASALYLGAFACSRPSRARGDATSAPGRR